MLVAERKRDQSLTSAMGGVARHPLPNLSGRGTSRAYPLTAVVIPCSAPTPAAHSSCQSRRGCRLDRPSRAAGENADAIIALAMALDRLDNQPQDLEIGRWY